MLYFNNEKVFKACVKYFYLKNSDEVNYIT